MEKKLVEKMLRKCLKQYYEGDSAAIGEKEFADLVNQIFQAKEDAPAEDMYELINDIVYEFLTI